MGCDIHAYIDYDRINEDGEIYYTWNFSERIRLGRNYLLFALMAGVRYDENADEFEPLFEPRGLPPRVSTHVLFDEYSVYVTDGDWDEYHVSTERAEEHVSKGWSHWTDDSHHYISSSDWHSASWLTVEELEQVQEAYANLEFPDMRFHQRPDLPPPPNASLVKEVKDPLFGRQLYIEIGERKKLGPNRELAAIIAAMKELQRGLPPGSVRLVFWFDN